MQDTRDIRDKSKVSLVPVKSSIRQHGEVRQQRTDALMLHLQRSKKDERKQVSSSALDELEKLVKTTPLVTGEREDDITLRETSLVPSYRPPDIRLWRYQSPLVLISPLAAIEAAIINHVDKFRSLPEAIYVHTYTMPELEQQYRRVKFYPFNGVYHYFSGYRLETIIIYEEKDLPQWIHSMITFTRDMMYTAIQSVM